MQSQTPTPPSLAPTPTTLPRNDSFTNSDLTKAFQASARKPRNQLSLKIMQSQDDKPTAVPPPSPLEGTWAYARWGEGVGVGKR